MMLEEKMCKIEENSDTILEILHTWNNTKGFVSTMRIIGKVVIWLAATTAAIAGIRHFWHS